MIEYLLGAGAVSAAGAAVYQMWAPRGQWYGRTFTGLEPGSKQLALTYDDGPNEPHTVRLLEVLAKHDVHATFFMIGRYVERRTDIAREVARAGHAIGNHTFTHPSLIFQTALQTSIQLEECRRALSDAVGEHSPLFRPPFGERRPKSLRIGRSLGLEPVMWSVTGFDWQTTSADYVERKVRKPILGGDVILLHDGSHRRLGENRAHTVEVTDRLIRRYQAEGYEFVTIPEMMTKAVGAIRHPKTS